MTPPLDKRRPQKHMKSEGNDCEQSRCTRCSCERAMENCLTFGTGVLVQGIVNTFP